MPTFDSIGDNLFGRSLRLFVAHWILAQHERQFFQLELVSACGRYSTNALKPLKQLVTLGLVEELPSHIPGQRRRYYRQKNDPLWEAISIAVRAAGLDPMVEPRMTLGEVGESDRKPDVVRSQRRLHGSSGRQPRRKG